SLMRTIDPTNMSSIPPFRRPPPTIPGSAGRGFSRFPGMSNEPGPARDDVIKGTDDDAIVSRLYARTIIREDYRAANIVAREVCAKLSMLYFYDRSAVNLGYLDDPYVKHFVKRASRRPPIINRGTFVRTYALDVLVEKFIQKGNDPKM